MSFTFVQRAPVATTAGGSSITATFTSPVTPGHLIVAYVSEFVFGGLPTPSIVDSGSNSYSLVDSNATGATSKVACSIWWTQVTTGGSGLAITFSGVGGTPGAALVVEEWATSGLVSMDTHSSANGNSSALSPGSITTTGPSDLVVAVGVIRTTGVSWTPGTGFSTGDSDAGTAIGAAFLTQEKTGVSAGSITASMTSSASSQWACVSVAFTSGGTFARAIEAGDTFAGSGDFATSASMAKTEAHDSFAGSGHFSDLGTLSATGGSDTASFVGKFTSPAAMAKTETSDIFAGSAKFLGPATMAKTESHDSFAASGHFATTASIAVTEAHDAFAGSGVGPTARIAATEHGDTFSGTATVNDIAAMAASERHDAMSCFAQVSPFLRAREGGDHFSGAGASTTSTSSMAATGGSDSMVATAGFSFDVVATLHSAARGDTFSATATQSSSAVMAAHEHGDSFHGSSSVHVVGSMAATEHGDVMRAGFDMVLYTVYSNTGHGDPIDYGLPVDVTAGLTYTTAPLAFPGTWKFAARARWAVSGLEEQNIDCMVTIILDASGKDITNQPPSPSGLRCFPLAGGTIRAEWMSPPTTGPKTPQGFHVYTGVGSVDYSTIVATVLYGSAIFGSYVANLTGFTDGVTYLVGVRAFNSTSEEQNTTTVSVTAIATGPTAVSGLTAVATARG